MEPSVQPTTVVRLASDTEIVIERELQAPRTLVFEALTRPEHLRRWWGPFGFENDVRAMEVRPGGAWEIIQRDPDGNLHEFRGVYREVAPPERLVFTQRYGAAGHEHEEWVVTYTLRERGAATHLEIRTRFASAQGGAQARRHGMEIGMRESMERLEALLAAGTADHEGRTLLAMRVLQAAREQVWEMWTNAEHLARWWGPQGFTTVTSAIDVREGGRWRFEMRGPDGTVFPNEMEYLAVERPSRLLYRHLVEPWFEHEVTFVELGSGKTRVMVQMRFPSAAERVRAQREYGAAEGLEQTLHRLAQQVEAL